MRRILKRAVHGLLSPLGMRLFRLPAGRFHKDYVLLTTQYEVAVYEIYGYLQKFVFKDLLISGDEIKLITQLYGTGISEALYLIHYLRPALALEGDVCEFGTANGATSALLAHELIATDKTLWLFDSFKGLPRPTAKDKLLDDTQNLGSIENYEGTMLGTAREVKARIESVGFPSERIRIIPGFIEETIQQAGLPSEVCFAYLDFDFYLPIRTALEYLDTRMANQGIIVVDDYGSFSEGARTAVEEFLARNPRDYARILPEKFAGHFCLLVCTRESNERGAGQGPGREKSP